MGDNGDSKIAQLAEMATFLGEGFAIKQAQKYLLPHVLDIFAKHDHRKVRNMIVTNYPLVENDCPEKVKNIFRNLNSNPKTRDLYHNLLVEHVTPERLLELMEAPEEWLEGAEYQEQRTNLRASATVIQRTPGGEEWLAQQVYTLYQFAGIAPEDSTRMEAND